MIGINFNLFSNEQGVLSLCEEIDRKRLRIFFSIVYPLSAQSSRPKPSLLALSADTLDWMAE